jgi:hypothetical protein
MYGSFSEPNINETANNFDPDVIGSDPVFSSDVTGSEPVFSSDVTGDVTGSEPFFTSDVTGSQPVFSSDVTGSKPLFFTSDVTDNGSKCLDTAERVRDQFYITLSQNFCTHLLCLWGGRGGKLISLFLLPNKFDIYKCTVLFQSPFNLNLTF